MMQGLKMSITWVLHPFSLGQRSEWSQIPARSRMPKQIRYAVLHTDRPQRESHCERISWPSLTQGSYPSRLHRMEYMFKHVYWSIFSPLVGATSTSTVWSQRSRRCRIIENELPVDFCWEKRKSARVLHMNDSRTCRHRFIRRSYLQLIEICTVKVTLVARCYDVSRISTPFIVLLDFGRRRTQCLICMCPLLISTQYVVNCLAF